MIHLTTTGPHAGVPYCQVLDYCSGAHRYISDAVDAAKAADPDAKFAHAFRVDLSSPDVCHACKEEYLRE